MTTLALTGVTGNIGGRVARLLAATDRTARVLARSPERVADLGFDVRKAAFGDATAVRRSLAGINTVLMVSAGESADRVSEHTTFIDAAAAAGVQHIVYLSFVGAGPNAGFLLARDHGATEDHLRSSGLAWTFLRDNFYAEALRGMAGDDGVIRGPAGQGRVAAVGYDDVAAVAAAVLADPTGHRGQAYEVTGPEAVTLTELAETLTECTGSRFSFHDETLAQARASRAPYGAPEWMVDAWISTYTAISDGELARVSHDVERVLGRPARTLREIFDRRVPTRHRSGSPVR